MEQRVALVTGAAHGIGRATAERLVHDNWQVVGLDLATPTIPGVRMLQTDISDETQVAAAIANVQARESRLDALISNAGIMVRKPLATLTLADWNRVLATNLTAAFLLARAAEPMLREAARRQSGAAIVLIASTRARMSEPDTESYAASKGALVALTHALATSLGPIRVNCISPGWIDVKADPLRPEDHDQHPAGRVGRPEDVAALAAWLTGPESTFVTGAEFVTDGGMTRKMIYT